MPTGTVETFLVGGTGRQHHQHQINTINAVTVLSCDLNANNGGNGLGNFNTLSRNGVKDWNQEIEISTVAAGLNQKLEINEFVGVGGLDILQGVSKGEFQ